MNKLSKKYIENAKTLFPIMSKSERDYLYKLKLNVVDYLSESPDSSMEDLIQEFGSPEEIVASYFTSVDTDVIIKKIRLSRYLRIMLLTIILCLLSFTSLFLKFSYDKHQVFMDESAIIEDTVIE